MKLGLKNCGIETCW